MTCQRNYWTPHEWYAAVMWLALTQRPFTVLSSVEGMTDTFATCVVTLAIFTGTVTSYIRFSGCIGRVYMCTRSGPAKTNIDSAHWALHHPCHFSPGSSVKALETAAIEVGGTQTGSNGALLIEDYATCWPEVEWLVPCVEAPSSEKSTQKINTLSI